MDGETVSLSDYRGQPVVLNFWATWCTPCREEMPLLQETYKAHQDAGLVVLGVNVRETPEAVAGFLKEVGVDFPFLLDTDSAVVNRYLVNSLPMTFFIDREGRLRDSRCGRNEQEGPGRALVQDSLNRYLPVAKAPAALPGPTLHNRSPPPLRAFHGAYGLSFSKCTIG